MAKFAKTDMNQTIEVGNRITYNSVDGEKQDSNCTVIDIIEDGTKVIINSKRYGQIIVDHTECLVQTEN